MHPPDGAFNLHQTVQDALKNNVIQYIKVTVAKYMLFVIFYGFCKKHLLAYLYLKHPSRESSKDTC